MKILTSGCSFTYNAWPKFFPEHEVKNLASSGPGNKYIADSIIHEISANHYDLVLVMWSGLTRLDLPVTKNVELLNDYSCKKQIGAVDYVFSGGLVGSWTTHPITKLLFENTYKVMEVDDLMLLSLLEIVKLQGILKSRNINYRFMSYVNYWKRPDEWLSKNCDKGINNYPILTPVVDQIDFTQWVFSNEDKDGLFELAESLNEFQDDGWHPNDVSNEQWAKSIINSISL
jgi:hypothetical protein